MDSHFRARRADDARSALSGAMIYFTDKHMNTVSVRADQIAVARRAAYSTQIVLINGVTLYVEDQIESVTQALVDAEQKGVL